MTEPDLQRAVAHALEEALTQAGLAQRLQPIDDGWEIAVRYEKMDEETCGVVCEPAYRRATFYFDLQRLAAELAEHADPAGWLREYVRHEVVHVLLAPLARAADLLAQDHPATARLVDEAHEMATHQLTVLWCRLAERA